MYPICIYGFHPSSQRRISSEINTKFIIRIVCEPHNTALMRLNRVRPLAKIQHWIRLRQNEFHTYSQCRYWDCLSYYHSQRKSKLHSRLAWHLNNPCRRPPFPFACLRVSAYVEITPPFIEQYVYTICEYIHKGICLAKRYCCWLVRFTGLDYAQSSPCVCMGLCLRVWLRKLHANVIVMRIAYDHYMLNGE